MDATGFGLKSATDHSFREALEVDAARVLTDQGVPLPTGVTVHVEPSRANEFVISLPALRKQGSEDVELDEDQIASMAGGMTWIPALALIAFVGGATTATVVAINNNEEASRR